MPPGVTQLDDEALEVRKCQEGNPEALAAMRDRHHALLQNILRSRGASLTEAEDVLADLWCDCVPGPGERPSLLEKFSGKCSLRGWLATVVTNRWVDVRRRQARQAELGGLAGGGGTGESLETLPAADPLPREDGLVRLLADSLRAGFAHCQPEAVVCLRLVHLHGLTQREVVKLLGWSESKVSRFLSQALEQIQRQTLRELKRQDPWLELGWQDFVDLCETHRLGFL